MPVIAVVVAAVIFLSMHDSGTGTASEGTSSGKVDTVREDRAVTGDEKAVAWTSERREDSSRSRRREEGTGMRR